MKGENSCDTRGETYLFFNNKFASSNSGKISISRNEASKVGMSEREIIQYICLLEREGFLNIKTKSVHSDLSMPCTVSLNSSCVHYFDNKKIKKAANQREWIRTYIPNMLSIVAIIISVIALIVSIQYK